MRPTRHITGLRLTSSLAIVLLAGTVLAQDGADGHIGPENGVDEIIGMLDAPSFFDRDAARAALAQHPSLTDAKVRSLLTEDALSPEQRVSLESILLERYTALPVGAIGITFSNEATDGRGLIVGAVNANFPAVQQNLVRENDLITGVDGIDFLAMDLDPNQLADRGVASRAIRTQVFSRIPGETVAMTIIREVDGREERLELNVPLGDINNHAQTARPDDVRAQSLRIRLERETGMLNEPDARMPLTDSFWPEPLGDMPQRLAINPVQSGPAPMTNDFNVLDPYAPRRTQDMARQSFQQYSKLMEIEKQALGNKALQQPQRMIAQVRVRANNAVVDRQIAAELKLRNGRTATGASALPPDPKPVVSEIVRLRDDLASLGRALASSTDEPTRTRLRERMDEAALRIDDLHAVLSERIVDAQRAEQENRQLRARDEPQRIRHDR